MLGDHAGTHVDAPCHFDDDPDALSIDKMPLETFFTEAVCLDLSHKPRLIGGHYDFANHAGQPTFNGTAASLRSMSSIGSIALSGMQAATTRLQSSANNIANPNAGGDLADNIAEQVVAQSNVSMSLKMIRADHDMTQALLDILV